MIQPIDDTVESKLDPVDSRFGSNIGSAQISVRFRSRCSRTTRPINPSASGFPRSGKPQTSLSLALSLALGEWVSELQKPQAAPSFSLPFSLSRWVGNLFIAQAQLPPFRQLGYFFLPFLMRWLFRFDVGGEKSGRSLTYKPDLPLYESKLFSGEKGIGVVLWMLYWQRWRVRHEIMVRMACCRLSLYRIHASWRDLHVLGGWNRPGLEAGRKIRHSCFSTRFHHGPLTFLSKRVIEIWTSYLFYS